MNDPPSGFAPAGFAPGEGRLTAVPADWLAKTPSGFVDYGRPAGRAGSPIHKIVVPDRKRRLPAMLVG
jgi:hypothetical protein